MISFRGMAQIPFCKTGLVSPLGIALAVVIGVGCYATSSACKRALCAARIISGFSATWRRSELSAQLGIQADINGRRLRNLQGAMLDSGRGCLRFAPAGQNTLAPASPNERGREKAASGWSSGNATQNSSRVMTDRLIPASRAIGIRGPMNNFADAVASGDLESVLNGLSAPARALAIAEAHAAYAGGFGRCAGGGRG
jgi:hypothetical protein